MIGRLYHELHVQYLLGTYPTMKTPIFSNLCRWSWTYLKKLGDISSSIPSEKFRHGFPQIPGVTYHI